MLPGQDVPSVTSKIFVENVMIHPKPGATPYIGHILLEDGIITNVGASISQPFDAKAISGDSLHVYAGFIATLSNIGLEKPKDDNERPRVARTGYPPNNVAGITPEQGLDDLYKSSERSISDYRKQGFAIAHAVPYGKMLPGKGSVISLNGGSFNEALISKDATLFAQWVTANRVFPATLIGIMAKWRELYRNAELANQHASAYELNPRNKKRPDQDKATSALFPVVDGTMPVFFHAEKHRDISRTLQLQRDLGFNLVIAEVKEGDRILGPLKSSGAQVLLSLDLPKEEKDKENEKKEDADMSDLDKERMQLGDRKKKSAERYVSQSKLFVEQNLPLAFSYMDVKAKDVHSNIRRMIAAGLSEQDALSALTTQAASTLGISSIAGTIERGKLGNLVIATAPIFDEKAKIKMVVIDGKVHEYEVKEKKKKSGDAAEDVDFSGNWSYSIDIPGMTPSGTMEIKKADDSYEVVVESNQAPGEKMNAENVDVNGSDLSFSFTVNTQGMSITVENELTFDGDTFEGSVTIPDFGSFEITGQKDDSPE